MTEPHLKETDMKCIKCGGVVTEKEWMDRYNELLERGIVAMMVPMCKQCRHADNYSTVNYERKESK
jgi:NAD-dependent SIR2 family protein deacetylase